MSIVHQGGLQGLKFNVCSSSLKATFIFPHFTIVNLAFMQHSIDKLLMLRLQVFYTSVTCKCNTT